MEDKDLIEDSINTPEDENKEVEAEETTVEESTREEMKLASSNEEKGDSSSETAEIDEDSLFSFNLDWVELLSDKYHSKNVTFFYKFLKRRFKWKVLTLIVTLLQRF